MPSVRERLEAELDYGDGWLDKNLKGFLYQVDFAARDAARIDVSIALALSDEELEIKWAQYMMEREET